MVISEESIVDVRLVFVRTGGLQSGDADPGVFGNISIVVIQSAVMYAI